MSRPPVRSSAQNLSARPRSSRLLALEVRAAAQSSVAVEDPVHVVVVVPPCFAVIEAENFGMAVREGAHDLARVRRAHWGGSRVDATVERQFLLVEGAALKHNHNAGRP